MKELAIRTCLGVASPGGESALSILIYHRVLRQADALVFELPDAATFERQMIALRSNFDVIPLADAVQALRDGNLPRRAACVTFDDGYADNFTIALPILKRHGIPATFFIAAGFLDGGCMWNDLVIESVRQTQAASLDLPSLGIAPMPTVSVADRRRALVQFIGALKYQPIDARDGHVQELVERCGTRVPDGLMLTSEQVRQLAAEGMEIGGHTMRHPILTRIGLAQARAEIVEGCARLKAICGRPVRFFAYPNGQPVDDYGQEHVGLVRALGFEAAVSTGWGAARTGDDLYELPRFTPWGTTSIAFKLRLLQNLVRSRFRLPPPPLPELQS